jgi:hypothetical protein
MFDSPVGEFTRYKYDKGASGIKAPLVANLFACLKIEVNRSGEPLLDVAFHDHVENFLAVGNRLVDDLWIVF